MNSDSIPYTPEMKAAAARRRQETEQRNAEIEAFVERHGSAAFNALRHGMHLLGVEPVVFIGVSDIHDEVEAALGPDGGTEQVMWMRPKYSKIDDLTWAMQVAELYDDWPQDKEWIPELTEVSTDSLPDSVWESLDEIRNEMLESFIKRKLVSLNPV